MNVSDWITLSAVFVALGLGVSSLIQTQMLQKKDRKERLLNEIIEWAEDVAQCGKSSDLSNLLQPTDEKLSLFLPLRMKEAALSIGLTEVRNEYISTLTITFGRELHEDVDRLIDELKTYKRLLESESAIQTITPASIEKLDSNDRQLIASTKKVIQEATKIKIKDIA